jgi:hypothetical protein
VEAPPESAKRSIGLKVSNNPGRLFARCADSISERLDSYSERELEMPIRQTMDCDAEEFDQQRFHSFTRVRS